MNWLVDWMTLILLVCIGISMHCYWYWYALVCIGIGIGMHWYWYCQWLLVCIGIDIVNDYLQGFIVWLICSLKTNRWAWRRTRPPATAAAAAPRKTMNVAVCAKSRSHLLAVAVPRDPSQVPSHCTVPANPTAGYSQWWLRRKGSSRRPPRPDWPHSWSPHCLGKSDWPPGREWRSWRSESWRPRRPAGPERTTGRPERAGEASPSSCAESFYAENRKWNSEKDRLRKKMVKRNFSASKLNYNSLLSLHHKLHGF